MDFLVRGATSLVQKYLPDPFVFAIILTLLVFGLSVVLTSHSPLAVLSIWGGGLWNLLGFTMQMIMVVVSGHALASSGLVGRGLNFLAALPKSPRQGVMLVTVVGALACIINWGFGLIVGAMLARAIARKIPDSDYPLLIASAYMAFLTWHGGLSGSIPLLAATPGNPLAVKFGLIPLSSTLFTPMNIFITSALVLCLPFLSAAMLPVSSKRKQIAPQLLNPTDLVQEHANTIKDKSCVALTMAQRMEQSRILSVLIGGAGLTYLGVSVYNNGGKIDINSVNLLFLALGLLLHKTPMAYANAIADGVRNTTGIIIQFPLYAGIQAMLEHSGLGAQITEWFIMIATKETFPLLAFFSSGLINFAVPSGGGHWVVQGPFIMESARNLGVDPGKAAMAIAYGEAWMNMAQPFWALPALAIAGLGARDIMGYCLIALFFSAGIFILGIQLF